MSDSTRQVCECKALKKLGVLMGKAGTLVDKMDNLMPLANLDNPTEDDRPFLLTLQTLAKNRDEAIQAYYIELTRLVNNNKLKLKGQKNVDEPSESISSSELSMKLAQGFMVMAHCTECDKRITEVSSAE